VNAKEMFEKLGYELEEDNWIIYSNEEDAIVFMDDKTFYKRHYYDAGDITMKELQAINKQVEELGWNNEK
jgi:5-bromo-4-chloroindolyl phosphate hydrolysis protein